MRTRKFLINSITTGAYQFILMITGFVTPQIMLRFYGSEVNGLISSINQFFIYFSLVEAGLSGAAIYALYKPLADQNYKEINAIVAAAKKFYNQSGHIFMLLTIVLSFVYPLWIHSSVISSISAGMLVFILGTKSALEFFTLSKYRVILTADQKTYIISIASIVYVLINTFIVAVFGMLRVNVVLLYMLSLLAVLIRTLILFVYVKREYTYLNYSESPNEQALNRRWDALYLQILGAIHKGAPVMILTIVTKDLKLVSVYTIFNMIISAINSILSIFTSGLSASFGEVISKNETGILKKAYNEFEFAYYALITVVYTIAMVTIMPFIRIYTDGIVDVNYDIPILGFLFVINGLLYNIKTPQGMLVISAGMFKETKLQTTIQGAIVVVVGLILTPKFGLLGVLVGSIVSNLYRDFDLIVFVSRRITMLPLKQSIVRVLRIIVTTFILYVPFIFIKLNTSNYIEWFWKSAIVGLYVLIVVTFVSYIVRKTP